jgi:uncharacterized protein
VHELVVPHHADDVVDIAVPQDASALEDEKVAGAIRTDMILSAEIMAITLASVATSSILAQAAVLTVVGLGITGVVYGAVALIVKADDFGIMLARRGGLLKAIGLGIVKIMPGFLKVLSLVGTAAMLWVGGGIIIHGLAGYGLAGIEHAIHNVAVVAASALRPIADLVNWLVSAGLAGIFGLGVGFVTALIIGLVASARARSSAKPV